jgi:hypothetical protein
MNAEITETTTQRMYFDEVSFLGGLAYAVADVTYHRDAGLIVIEGMHIVKFDMTFASRPGEVFEWEPQDISSWYNRIRLHIEPLVSGQANE